MRITVTQACRLSHLCCGSLSQHGKLAPAPEAARGSEEEPLESNPESSIHSEGPAASLFAGRPVPSTVQEGAQASQGPTTLNGATTISPVPSTSAA